MSDSDEKTEKTDWAGVSKILENRKPSHATIQKSAHETLASHQNLPAPGEPPIQPVGILAQYKHRKIQRNAAIDQIDIWYKGRLEMARHAISEAIRVKKAEASEVAERLLMSIDAEHLEYLTTLGIRNEGTRNKAFAALGDQTAKAMKDIHTRDWPPELIEETLGAILDRHRKFFERIKEDLGTEKKR